MTDSPGLGLDYLAGARPQLVLRYLKHRWLRDIVDLLEQDPSSDTLTFDDLDIDTDVVELTRAAGRDSMAGVAQAILDLREPIAPEAGVLEALGPELSAGSADVFLRLVAINLAFRLRSDALLAALVRHTAAGVKPRLAPAQLGALLVRARSRSAARALLEADLEGPALTDALAACEPAEVDLRGTRIHLEADHLNLELALERVLTGLRLVSWTDPSPDTRRLLALRRRGGFVTLLEEGAGNPPLELARALARDTAVGRAAWVQVVDEQTPQLVVIDGTRVTLDRDKLTTRLGREPELEDLAGELRALGVHDLDPGHSRGHVALDFETYLRRRKKGIKAMAFGTL